MPERVCLDANVVLAWLLPEALSARAIELRRQWAENQTELVAPPLLRAEVTSILREKAYRKELNNEEAREALARSTVWPIQIVEPPGLQDTALQFATRFKQPKAYDAQYLALASILACELWTLDRKLANAVRPDLPWVRSLKETK